MRAMLSLSVLLLALSGCASTPNAGGGAPSQPALDPERITKLEFYGGRCVGEPSADGVAGVTGVQLPVGKMFVAELNFNGGTGYSWVATGYDESIVKMAEQRTRPIRGTDAVGALQLHTMNFVGVKPGRTRITFELRRPWETAEKPAETRRTTIYVVEAPKVE